MREKKPNKSKKKNATYRRNEYEEQKPVKKKRSRNREFARITYLFVGLFLVMIGYLVYFNVVRSTAVLSSSYNNRQDRRAERISRGTIYANDGTVLAEMVGSGDDEKRSYPYGSLFAHTVGYPTHGKSGIEAVGNSYLMESNITMSEKIMNELKEIKNPGDNIYTTLDVSLQQIASEALGSNRGAVVAIEPSTGKVLASVSQPGFDPNNIDELWDTFEDSELYNRASQGQYPPGSTFKIVTALAYMRENPDYQNYSYTCTGSIQEGDLTIKCAKGQVHGAVNFDQSFAKSCNTSFVNMAKEMKAAKYQKTAEELLFNQKIPYDLETSASVFPVNSKSSLGQRMMSGIGQAEVTASPMHMALIAAAVANDGVVMQPYLMDKVVNRDGEEIESFEPKEYKQIMSLEESAALRELMAKVVSEGTGSKLQTDSYEVVGKTGTAEYNSDKNDTHSWFVGYASKDGRQIAIAVIAEGAGSGSEVAVPIAKAIFDGYL